MAIYFGFLSLISYFSSRNSSNTTFFSANKKSPWMLVAIGMIGASLSGVTFISIPGQVGNGGGGQAFSWMQMVLGFLVGYAIIAFVLMPLYYKWNLVSIYSYIGKRLGFFSQKTAASFFILSRVVGASLRLFLVAIVFQKFVMDHFGVPFFLTVAITIILIWVYTFRSGIKTIVWTDTIQTITMLTAVVLTILAIMNVMEYSFSDMIGAMREAGYSQIFFFEGGWNDPNNFFKQFIGGALIATAMTGLDQDMMQKNLTCNSLQSAQKNVAVFSIILVFANLLFLTLGALLYLYAQHQGVMVPERTDQLYPLLALTELPIYIGVFFVIGLIAAAYSSADSALTSLTTSFCIDFLGFESSTKTEQEKKRIRIIVHVGFSLLLLVIILLVKSINHDAVVKTLFRAAGYTYGPLIGLFAFGMFTNRRIRQFDPIQDLLVVFIALMAIGMTIFLDLNSKELFNEFTFGYTTLALNGLLMFIGLWLISEPGNISDVNQ